MIRKYVCHDYSTKSCICITALTESISMQTKCHEKNYHAECYKNKLNCIS